MSQPSAANSPSPKSSSGSGSSPIAAHVALVQGKAPQLASETQRLLRLRLRGAVTLFFMGSGLFLAREVATQGIGIFLPPSEFMPFILLALTATFGVCAALLWSQLPLSMFALRGAELLIFGLPAPVILAMEYSLNESTRSSGRNAVLTPVWLVLIFTYAMFIPNTWRRSAAVVGLLVTLPIVVYLIDRSSEANFRLDDALMTASPSILLLFIGATIAVSGAQMINSLRREAFEAKRFGQYVLKESLGAGAMGEVYLAEHQLLKRPCAIKVIRPGRAADPQALARFEREVRETARLSHWNIVEVFDYGRTEDGTFYYVMEYLPGKTLGELVEQHGPMPPERAIHLLRQACDALREAHGQGLVHRDLKPSNIIAAQRGGVFDVVKIVDFGLVEATAPPAGRAAVGPGLILGSPLFMSPEQALAQQVPDARSDIYSLGAVAYFLVTGRPPFEGKKPVKVLVGHARDEVVRPSDLNPRVPRDLEEVILTCLAKDPAERYRNADSMARALAACGGADIWTRELAAQWWQDLDAPPATRAVEPGYYR